MLYLLLYLAIGLIVAVLCIVTEFMSASMSDLDVEDYCDWCNEPTKDFFIANLPLFIVALVIGLILWPLRAITWELERRARFEAYIAECEDEES